MSLLDKWAAAHHDVWARKPAFYRIILNLIGCLLNFTSFTVFEQTITKIMTKSNTKEKQIVFLSFLEVVFMLLFHFWKEDRFLGTFIQEKSAEASFDWKKKYFLLFFAMVLQHLNQKQLSCTNKIERLQCLLHKNSLWRLSLRTKKENNNCQQLWYRTNEKTVCRKTKIWYLFVT